MAETRISGGALAHRRWSEAQCKDVAEEMNRILDHPTFRGLPAGFCKKIHASWRSVIPRHRLLRVLSPGWEKAARRNRLGEVFMPPNEP